ncbi:hypothetical protein HMPREF9104_02390 [Lentilactobacillus kisonensis F0435]|nr:hypothetical protein HMPREF9104_02390 [Lentilactobacillus kisonensis F0435]
MPAKALNGIKEALVNAGPFSGHTIAFSTRMQQLPFAQDLQRIVIRAYDSGMTAVAISSGVIVLIGGLGAALLMRNRMASQDLELKQHQ